MEEKYREDQPYFRIVEEGNKIVLQMRVLGRFEMEFDTIHTWKKGTDVKTIENAISFVKGGFALGLKHSMNSYQQYVVEMEEPFTRVLAKGKKWEKLKNTER